MKFNIFKNIGGGGDDPNPYSLLRKAASVYTSQQQIDRDNAFLKSFLQRHNAPKWDVENSVVARKVGDKIPFFQQSPLRAMQGSGLTDLPRGVTINDVVQTQDGYGFFHPQEGNWIPVDAQAIFQKYGNKKTTK
jgi:hypothetical protein